MSSGRYNYFGIHRRLTEYNIQQSNPDQCQLSIQMQIAMTTFKVAQSIFSQVQPYSCFDVSGANKNLTSSENIVAANKGYSVNGSLHCF